MRVPVGAVSHFSLAVKDPAASAQWWLSNFEFDEMFRRGDRIGLTNDSLMIVLFRGDPAPMSIGHMAFRAVDLDALKVARDALRERGVNVEDPGDEIGPVAAGSTSMGLWFHDNDGYRWELYVEGP